MLAFLMPCLALTAAIPWQDPSPESDSTKIVVQLRAQGMDGKARMQWSPKGAAVPLELLDDALNGSFGLGPEGTPALAVRLEKSADSEHYDRLLIDRNRDGHFGEEEQLTAQPREQRGKIWSSFSTQVAIPLPGDGGDTRPYPLNLWFVVDPREPTDAPMLRWSRRGWHQGEVVVDGIAAVVLLTERKMDGVFDLEDSWALGSDAESVRSSRDSRSLKQHAWLDQSAYRVTRVDPHGRELVLEAYDPGITRAEEELRDDRLAADRNAERAPEPLAFRHDFAQAEADAKEAGKRLFIDFETTWCGPCKTMDRWVYTALDVVTGAAGDVAVKVDGDEERELVKRFEVKAYPTMILLSPKGEVIRRAVGYQSVAAMKKFLAATPAL